MCTLHDNSWFALLEWSKLGVIGLALLWTAYRSGAFASLSRWRGHPVAELELADEGAPLASHELQAA